MSSNDKEIEIKLKLNNKDILKDFLDKNAKKLYENKYQKDTYYTPIHRDFFSIEYPSEFLRIRETEKGTLINFKLLHPYNAKPFIYGDEYETSIGNADTMKKIFKSIDIKDIITIEKYRTAWEYKDVEIVIDVVTDLGTYMELELLIDVLDPNEGQKMLFRILEDLPADTEFENRGYPIIALNNKGYTHIK